MSIGRIAALTGPETVQVKSFTVPDPEPGAVLLAVRRANVCGTDIHQWHYENPALREAGLGHEFVAEIAALGDGVDTDYAGEPIAVGDRVVPVYYLTCHRCPPCLRAEFNSCRKGLASWSLSPEITPHFRSGFATHYYVHPGQFFYKVPDSVEDTMAAGANCGLAQTLFVLDRLRVQAGETVAIQGAGGLGLNAAAIARERGARVVVIDGVAERLALARRFGADEVIDLRQHARVADRVTAMGELTGGAGADVVLEVTGVPEAFAEGIELARTGGRFASVGNLNAEATVAISPGTITRKSLSVQGMLRYDPWYLHRALAFLARRGRCHPFHELSDRAYGLDRVAEALHTGDNRSVARAAVTP